MSEKEKTFEEEFVHFMECVNPGVAKNTIQWLQMRSAFYGGATVTLFSSAKSDDVREELAKSVLSYGFRKVIEEEALKNGK